MSAAFIKELLRKAALFAADASDEDPIRVTDEDLDQALFDLVVEGETWSRPSWAAPAHRTEPRGGRGTAGVADGRRAGVRGVGRQDL